MSILILTGPAPTLSAMADQDNVEAPRPLKKQRRESAPQQDEPVTLQFFVKWDGKTLVLRESDNTLLKDLKVFIMEWKLGVEAKWKASTLASAVYFTCEGRRLNEDLSLKELHMQAGATLLGSYRVDETDLVYAAGKLSALSLHRLASCLSEEQPVSTSTTEKVLQELSDFLRPKRRAFSKVAYVELFMETGGIEAIMQLLIKPESQFLALAWIREIAERASLVISDKSSHSDKSVLFVARLLAWELLWDVLDTYTANLDVDPVGAALDVLLGPNWEKEFTFLFKDGPQSEEERRMRSCRTGSQLGPAMAKVVQKLLAEVGEGLAMYKVGSSQREGLGVSFSIFPRLLSLFRFYHPDPRSDRLYAKGTFYDSLEIGAKQLLGEVYRFATEMEVAARQTASLDSKAVRPITDDPLNLAIHGLSKLPKVLLSGLCLLLKFLFDLTEEDDQLAQRFLSFVETGREVLNALLNVPTKYNEYAAHDLPFLLRRPYRHLWPLETKERVALSPYLPEPFPPADRALEHEPYEVSRENVLEDAFQVMEGLDSDFDLELLQAHGLNVNFEEGGAEGAHVVREFLVLVSEELFNPKHGLFVTSPYDRRRVFPNHAFSGRLDSFRYCGQLVALAFKHEVQLGVTFCSALLDALEDEKGAYPVKHTAASEVDPELYQLCEDILKLAPSEVEDLGLTFVCNIDQLGISTEVELRPGGKKEPVTAKNRHEFVNLKVQKQLLDPVKEQVRALREGMASILWEGRQWSQVFGCLTHEEFAAKMQGATSDICIKDWQEHTSYHSCAPTDDIVRFFWAAVLSLSPEQQRRLLFFATAVHYLPHIGFKGLPRRFRLRIVEKRVHLLPDADTDDCELVLPKYTSFAMMLERLEAVSSSTWRRDTETSDLR